MEIINFSTYKFRKLQKLKLHPKLLNCEAELFIIDDKNKWESDYKVLKVFFNNQDDIFSNKLFTINSLIANKDKINISELVLPEKLASINDKITGYTMPYIENTNFEILLSNFNISNKEKLTYFKQIGSILEKMKTIRNNTSIKDFYLNDLHEGNFILNHKTKKINVVDLDSCKINNNKPFAAKYLSPISIISDITSKYIHNNEYRYPGFIIPNENSDLYCFNVMVLNYLLQTKISKLSIEQFYVYMNYLRSIGLPYKIVDKFAKIYQCVNNENIVDDLDYITDSILEKSNILCYSMKTRQ